MLCTEQYYSNICQTKHRIKKYIGYAFRSWLGMGLQRHGQLQGTLPPQGLPIPIESVHCTFPTSGDYMQSLRSLKNTCRASVHMMMILNKVFIENFLKGTDAKKLSKRNRCKKNEKCVVFFQTPKLACACFGEKHLVMEKMVH